MDFFDLIRQRRSVRKFVDKVVEPDKIELIKEALLRAPSGRNKEPWRYVIVQNKEILQKLSKTKAHGSALIASASLAVVIANQKDLTDVWVEDCSIASIYAQLAAEELGLSSCWVQIRLRYDSDNEDKLSDTVVKEILKLEDDLEIESIIAIGYPEQKPAPRPTEDLDYSKILKEFK